MCRLTTVGLSAQILSLEAQALGTWLPNRSCLL